MLQSRLNEIIRALRDKSVSRPCPRCDTTSFSVVGESEIIVKRESAGLLFNEEKVSVPIILIACDNCGYIAQHAQAALGLVPYSERRGILGGVLDE